METESRIAIIGIILEEQDAAVRVNEILHEFGDCIVGRMGVPYRGRGVSVISLIVDGSTDVINGLTGRLGSVRGASAKAMLTRR